MHDYLVATGRREVRHLVYYILLASSLHSMVVNIIPTPGHIPYTARMHDYLVATWRREVRHIVYNTVFY